MNKNSNAYIILYASVMIIIVALLLSLASLSLKDRQLANVMVEKKGAILASIGIGGDADKVKNKTEYIDELYDQHISQVGYVVDGNGNYIEGIDPLDLLDQLKLQYSKPQAERILPVFDASLENGTKLTVLPVYGTGLWGPIWGYIALEDDWNTIFGAVFDHEGETPGLGAEIASNAFAGQFTGKMLFRNGQFTGISVLKGAGSSAGNQSAVDAVSGGTITSRGVEDMLRNCLEAYLPFIEKQKAKGNNNNGMITRSLDADTENDEINIVL